MIDYEELPRNSGKTKYILDSYIKDRENGIRSAIVVNPNDQRRVASLVTVRSVDVFHYKQFKSILLTGEMRNYKKVYMDEFNCQGVLDLSHVVILDKADIDVIIRTSSYGLSFHKWLGFTPEVVEYFTEKYPEMLI
ncbi:hypothetical protein WCWAEYFT_CDS0084 [Vibrio phage VB_VaC_TDDLMA]